MNKKPTSPIFLIVLIFFVFVVGAGYIGIKKLDGRRGIGETTTEPAKSEPVGNSANEIDTSDWKVYRNEEYGLSFKYPSGWNLYRHEDESLELVARPISFGNSQILEKVEAVFGSSVPFETVKDISPHARPNVEVRYLKVDGYPAIKVTFTWILVGQGMKLAIHQEDVNHFFYVYFNQHSKNEPIFDMIIDSINFDEVDTKSQN